MKVTTTFLLLYIIRVGQGQGSCIPRCCQQKVVNNTRYILSHESKVYPSSCQDGCVYKMQNDCGLSAAVLAGHHHPTFFAFRDVPLIIRIRRRFHLPIARSLCGLQFSAADRSIALWAAFSAFWIKIRAFCTVTFPLSFQQVARRRRQIKWTRRSSTTGYDQHARACTICIWMQRIIKSCSVHAHID